MDLVDQLILVGTGLGAGLMGGLLGIGGSVVMIPIIVHVVGRDQHFAQGAAMLVNVFVAIPAALRHHKGGRVRKELVQWFKDNGVTVNEVDRTPFREATMKLHNGPDATWDQATYDKLQAIE